MKAWNSVCEFRLRKALYMPWDAASFKHQEATEAIIRYFYEVPNELGYGFLESLYEAALAQALREAGLDVKRQFPWPVFFSG